MKAIMYISVALLSAGSLVCGEVAAFQETGRSVTAAERSQADGGAVAARRGDGEKDLALSGADQAEQKSDKESPSLYIPGLGSVGSLPQVDFGLELLYQDDEALPTEKEETMGIKGRLKHKF